MEIPKNEHIKHAYATKRAPLREQIAEIAGLSLTDSIHLISFGAVYVNKERILSEGAQIPKDTYLRLHLYPKKYPVESIDWRSVIVDETDEYIVINKPAAIPLHATVDNYSQNCAFQIQRLIKKDIFVTHRLDRATQGLVVLAKTKEFQSWFNRMLIKHKVEKSYRAITEKPVPLGNLVHYMEPKERTPMHVEDTENPGWLRCELVVQSSLPLEIGKTTYYESVIQLLTGRTHQIRVQLGFLGSPILGDTMYGGNTFPEIGFVPDAHALQAFSLGFYQKSYSIERQKF